MENRSITQIPTYNKEDKEHSTQFDPYQWSLIPLHDFCVITSS